MQAALEIVTNLPLQDDLPIPQLITYRELAAQIYNTDQPSLAQRESVGRACRKLSSQGAIDRWVARRKVPSRKLRYKWDGTPAPVELRVEEGAVRRPFTEAEQLLWDKHQRNRNREKARLWFTTMSAAGTHQKMRAAYPEWYAEIERLLREEPED